MKKVKLFVAACMLLVSASSFAQQGKATLGIHGNALLEDPFNLGIGANVGYEVINNLRGVAEFNYAFKKDGESQWNVLVNAEYLFRIPNSRFTLYPLVGVDLFGWKADGFGSDSKLGFDFGAGVEYALTDNLSLKAEYNDHTVDHGHWHMLKLGVVIPF